jgi:hypothetical protein
MTTFKSSVPPESGTETSSLKLAKEYLSLGGPPPIHDRRQISPMFANGMRPPGGRTVLEGTGGDAFKG